MKVNTNFETKIKVNIEQNTNRQADLIDIKDERVRNEILEKIKEPKIGTNIDIEI